MIPDKSQNNSKAVVAHPSAGQYLCGFGASFHATESLWCIGSKLCWSNCLCGEKLSEIVFQKTRHNKFQHLLYAKHANFAELSSLTGIPSEVFREGTSNCLTVDVAPLDALAFKHLRFCVSCLENGFHSVLMQFPLFVRCPVHHQVLTDRCPKCGGKIDYAWPRRGLNAFRCECGASLYQPRQSHEVTSTIPTKTQMRTLASASASWIARTFPFGANGAALRIFMSEYSPYANGDANHKDDVCCIWNLLETAIVREYWTGEACTDAVSEKDSQWNEGTVYLNTLKEIVRCIGAKEESLLSWQLNGGDGPADDSRLTVQAWAFVWWRLFWENEACTTLPTATTKVMSQQSVADMFYRYFARETLPNSAAYETTVHPLRSIILTQVLRATYANAYRICSERNTSAMPISELRMTPMPVILVRLIEKPDYKVKWVHQRVLSFAKDFFSPKRAKNERLTA